MCKRILGYLLLTSVSLIAVAIFGLHFLYRPVSKGTIYLKHASGEAEILRELDTSIPHVYASSEKMAVYTEGFLHA